jgi:hypothetical protein
LGFAQDRFEVISKYRIKLVSDLFLYYGLSKQKFEFIITAPFLTYQLMPKLACLCNGMRKGRVHGSPFTSYTWQKTHTWTLNKHDQGEGNHSHKDREK